MLKRPGQVFFIFWILLQPLTGWSAASFCDWLSSGEAPKTWKNNPVRSEWAKQHLSDLPSDIFLNYRLPESKPLYFKVEKGSLAKAAPEALRMIQDLESWWIGFESVHKIGYSHNPSEKDAAAWVLSRTRILHSFLKELEFRSAWSSDPRFPRLLRYAKEQLEFYSRDHSGSRINWTTRMQQIYSAGLGAIGEAKAFLLTENPLDFARTVSQIDLFRGAMKDRIEALKTELEQYPDRIYVYQEKFPRIFKAHRVELNFLDSRELSAEILRELKDHIGSKEIDLLTRNKQDQWTWVEVKNGKIAYEFDANGQFFISDKKRLKQIECDLEVLAFLGLQDQVRLELMVFSPMIPEMIEHLKTMGVSVRTQELSN